MLVSSNSGESLTACLESEDAMRIAVRQARIDVESFRRRLSRCDLAHCRGMCCHLGVWLSDENAAVIESLARAEAGFFLDLGLDLPDQVIVDGEWRGEPTGMKTAVRQERFSKNVPDYPAHFSDTACVFLLADGRCALQLLSVARGKHPWYYKPIACWLHPISVTCEADGAEGVRVVLVDETTDDFRAPDYPGYTAFTSCGKTCATGRPAFEVLAEELAFLGTIASRDLIAEIKAAEPNGVSPRPDLPSPSQMDRARGEARRLTAS